MTDKVLICYPQIKPDGYFIDEITAAWIVYNWFKSQYDPDDHENILLKDICCNQNLSEKQIQKLKEQDVKEVVMVDCLFDTSTLEKFDSFANLTIIDHHEAAKAKVKKLDSWVNFPVSQDGDTSSSCLAWEHFCTDQEIPVFVSYIRDYVVMYQLVSKFHLPNSQKINSALLGGAQKLCSFKDLTVQLLFSYFDGLMAMDTKQLQKYCFDEVNANN